MRNPLFAWSLEEEASDQCQVLKRHGHQQRAVETLGSRGVAVEQRE
jgi:hypothetical protein